MQALLEAAALCDLDASDLREVCAGTAQRLFGLAPAPAVNQELYRRAKELIPGGTHLLSKRPELFAPDQWPPYFHTARGCTVYDLDDRAYTDFSINGIGACLLGYADPAVTRAVRRRLGRGSMCTLNPPEEVALAERLCQLHPWADQVRLARTGGEVAAVAVRIARATTGRSAVAICGYHGWADWYLAANLGESDALRGHLLPGLDPLGVPGELRGTAETFRFDHPEELAAIIARHGPRLAAVVMEPCRYQDPAPGCLERIHELTHGCGALLVFDEITIGWRLALGGAHLRLGVTPDMALFAKALGNGHPIAAVIGTRAAMSGAATSFISSSYWTESVGPVAALATLDRMAETDVVSHIARVGTAVQELWRQLATDFRLPLQVKGYPCAPSFVLDHPQGQELRTLFTQEMLRRGYLAGSLVYVTLAHTLADVAAYGAACREVAAELAAALAAGDVTQRLRGPVAHSGFRRLL
jgi:glutamate-1-semialdehyde 2,1-aminomutase